MKKINLLVIIIFMMLGGSSEIFAEAGSSTSSSITTTTNSGGEGYSKSVPPTQSTTYTTTKSSTTTSNSIDDDIVSAVYAQYAKDAALFGTTLKVSSQNGIVTVNGTVTSQSQADEASIAAKTVKGVKDVRSNITVTTNPNPYKPPSKPNY